MEVNIGLHEVNVFAIGSSPLEQRTADVLPNDLYLASVADLSYLYHRCREITSSRKRGLLSEPLLAFPYDISSERVWTWVFHVTL
jgi:hypothetical protein